jgi:hypothetical protein
MKTMAMSFLFSWLPPILICSSLVAATGKNNSKKAALQKLETVPVCVSQVEVNAPLTLFHSPAFLIVRSAWLY